MSRFKLFVGAVALAFMTSLLGAVASGPAYASGSPPPPLVADRCGTKVDQYMIPDVDTPSYHDSQGEYLPKNVWLSTGGASSVTVVAWSDPRTTFTLMFGTEPDSACVEALDTVTTQVVACNSSNNGTRVTFTYTNVRDATDRWHTNPYVYVRRWDGGQSAQMWPAIGRVADGASASITGGDTLMGGKINTFFLAPGTYEMTLRTDELGSRVLPNRLFVPACGAYKPPKGDPLGGPIPPPGSGTTTKPNRPIASIGKCHAHRVKVVLNGHKATRLTRFRLVIDPKKGKAKHRTYKVAAGHARVVVLKKQKKGTLIKVRFGSKVVKRKLRC